MKISYIKPNTKWVELIDRESELDVTSLPVADKEEDDTIDDYDDLLAKPGIIYDAWEDEDWR